MNVVNRLLGLVLGLALLAVGVLAVVEAIVALLDRPGWVLDREGWDAFLQQLTWEHRGLLLLAGALVLVGLALLVLQLRPSPPSALEIAEENPDRHVTLERRGLQELLRRGATEDEDVLDASVRVRQRAAKVTLQVPADAVKDEVRNRVRGRLEDRTSELRLAQPLGIKVEVERNGGRVR